MRKKSGVPQSLHKPRPARVVIWNQLGSRPHQEEILLARAGQRMKKLPLAFWHMRQ